MTIDAGLATSAPRLAGPSAARRRAPAAPLRLMLATLLVGAALAGPAAAGCPDRPELAGKTVASGDLETLFGPVPVPGKPVRFAYVTQVMNDPVWWEAITGLKAEAQRLGVTLETSAPADRSAAGEQLDIARKALATGPDVLILTGFDSTTLRPVIDAANAKGIPTLSLNMRAEGARVHIGTDQASLGFSSAEFLHEWLPAGAAVAQIEGEASSPYRIARVKGFTEGLRLYKNLHLVGSVAADWDDQKAHDATLSLMAAHPEVKGIYANSDLMAAGVISALKEIERIDDVVVVGSEGTMTSRNAIIRSELKGTAAQFPFKEGVLAIDTGLRLLACQPVPGWVVSPQAVMTYNSVFDYSQTQ